MKAFKFFAAALAILPALTGCQKTDLETMSGSYTYKTSGMVGLIPAVKSDSVTVEDTLWLNLGTEQGQMNIVTKDSGKSIMIVSWNDLTGDACSTEATLDGNVLTLVPNTKSVTVKKGDIPVGSITVTYSGKGTRYDNMLIFPLTYQGTFQALDTTMTIAASKVECIAKAN